jgi:hypothetical protein
MLTLFTTPVIYLGFDALGRKWGSKGRGSELREGAA